MENLLLCLKSMKANGLLMYFKVSINMPIGAVSDDFDAVFHVVNISEWSSYSVFFESMCSRALKPKVGTRK